LPVTDGDIAGWLLNGPADVLLGLRVEFDKTLQEIAGRRGDQMSAGAKGWMLYLLHQWAAEDRAAAEEVLAYLASGQLVDLPTGRRAKVWIKARGAAQNAIARSGGFKASNKEAHDMTLLIYTLAWMHWRSQITLSSNRPMLVLAAECYPVQVDSRTGQPTLSADGKVMRLKTARWPTPDTEDYGDEDGDE
jgi:hypothetical protein